LAATIESGGVIFTAPPLSIVSLELAN
jgi:hypothetical protein